MSSKSKSSSVDSKSKSAVAAVLSRPTSSKSHKTQSEEVQELRVAFNLLDRNKDGRLSVEELQMMLRNFGIHVVDDLVQDLFHHCSRTGSVLLTESEFVDFVRGQLEERGDSQTSLDLLAAFRVFDKDNNGFITRDELKTAMEMMGETLTDQDIDNMIALADTNKDGKIDYEEFSRLLS